MSENNEECDGTESSLACQSWAAEIKLLDELWVVKLLLMPADSVLML